MPATQTGSIRLFHFAGIDVFVHWSWLLVAIIEVQVRQREYESFVWNVVEYVSLFGIVLLHEFGHSLACRQVGGTANRIMLWPLGGVAFVSPPQRPGAVLWSIAAGPLVNVVLVPILLGVYFLAGAAGWLVQLPDFDSFLLSIMKINVGLLVFNMLPIYPLDGGQIAQALLWFVIGQARSLWVVSLFGLIIGAGLIALALWLQDLWIVVLALFMASRSWNGFQQARGMLRIINAPRHYELRCPTCGAPPPAGAFWACGQCGAKFDTFDERGVCPGCGAQFAATQCQTCHARHPIETWGRPTAAR
jgi:Zn-dependent protease